MAEENDETSNSSTSHPARADAAQQFVEAAAGRRELLIFEAGGRSLGVFAGEAEAIAEWREPALLPHAPPGVLGVALVRGRALTVLDSSWLLGEQSTADEAVATPPHQVIIPLRGDEQLALAARRAARSAEISLGEISAPSDEEARSGVALGQVVCGGERVTVLDVTKLFEAAMRGTERRRARFPEAAPENL